MSYTNQALVYCIAYWLVEISRKKSIIDRHLLELNDAASQKRSELEKIYDVKKTLLM